MSTVSLLYLVFLVMENMLMLYILLLWGSSGSNMNAKKMQKKDIKRNFLLKNRNKDMNLQELYHLVGMIEYFEWE